MKIGMLIGLAIVVGFILLVRITSNPDCKHIETREVEMPHELAHGMSYMGKHQYKVCVDE